MSDAPLTEEEFWAVLQVQPAVAPTEPEYRLYYDGDGFLLFFSMEDLPGNYLRVDRETYLNGKHLRVVNGELKVYRQTFGKKLVPGSQGQACDPRDVAVVVAQDQPHTRWYLKHEEPTDDTN